ncbi:hypothetical protein [Marinobacter sp. CHS3-4]|uniref:hypothetical protein n=1 Tax=Marinobacter sp. CHS3-4 TaxID=3045174 RepID=UPI0024B5AF37|nr:hypothetical protein [Marinobacter sp. CHS3-4]MDI9245324.1 hypothetical protein [Marinobacter sp. CHS3-4]
MTLAIASRVAGHAKPGKIRLLLLSLFVGSLILALIMTWVAHALDREEAEMHRLTETILATEGDVRQLRAMLGEPDYESTSLFWGMYSKSLLMAGKSDHLIQRAIAQGLNHTQGWEFIRLVENVEPYVMGYTSQQISAYQRLIAGFKDPALEFDSDFVVLWKTCIDSFANRYDGYTGRILYYQDVLRWEDKTLCPGLKDRAHRMLQHAQL